VIGRSIVIHGPEGSRIACGTIKSPVPLKGAKATFTGGLVG
jgi:hypothetical protein